MLSYIVQKNDNTLPASAYCMNGIGRPIIILDLRQYGLQSTETVRFCTKCSCYACLMPAVKQHLYLSLSTALTAVGTAA